MNPFRKRSKSTSAGDDKKSSRGREKVSNATKQIQAVDIPICLPDENEFRTSLLLPKMADRFSLLRLEDQIHNEETNQSLEFPLQSPTAPYRTHARDLSVLQEWDEEDDDLPIKPWERTEGRGKKDGPNLHDAMSVDDFMRARAAEGNSLFSGRQRTFKIRSEDGNGTKTLRITDADWNRY